MATRKPSRKPARRPTGKPSDKSAGRSSGRSSDRSAGKAPGKSSGKPAENAGAKGGARSGRDGARRGSNRGARGQQPPRDERRAAPARSGAADKAAAGRGDLPPQPDPHGPEDDFVARTLHLGSGPEPRPSSRSAESEERRETDALEMISAGVVDAPEALLAAEAYGDPEETADALDAEFEEDGEFSDDGEFEEDGEEGDTPDGEGWSADDGDFAQDDADFAQDDAGAWDAFGEEGSGAHHDDDGAARATAYAVRPLIAIVGRPNVGKSRLFNRMTGTRFAIVEDQPGVTRDRQYGEGVWEGRAFQVVDTGGFEPDTVDVLLSQMKEQAQLAMEEADIILFVMDARAGLLPADRTIAALLRQSDKVVIPVVNKVDGPQQDLDVNEFHALGLHEAPVGISAEHGREYGELMDRVHPFLPRLADVEARESQEIRIAVVGRPNAGKSTLVNRLLGEERLLTSDIPGTTRDAINTRVEVDGQPWLFIDTAGVRRKRSISETVEKYSVVQAFKAIDRADIVLYVLDATAGVTAQDLRVCGMVHDKGRAALLILNKWDAVEEKDHKTADTMIRSIRDSLKFNRYAPIVTISAKTGQRVHRILPIVRELHDAYTRRISTSELNRVVRDALARTPPMPSGRRRLKVFYASQVATRPPTIMLVVNSKELMHFSYERYLRNCLRRAFGFEGSPIKLFLRERAQRDKAVALND